ncbi:MAG: prefoldin subunit beta [Candidatus Bathyarchaeota archaeon]|nr:MAG: prefoldin subunit beta [Candidatus Bathyarchaeota archaeon]
MSEASSLPPQLQEQLLRLQQLQQTLQVVVSQRQQLELEHSEVNRALSELEKITDDSTIYKTVGSILIKSERKKVIDELREKRELTETRIKVLTRQQTRAEARVKELQQIIQAKLKTSV